MATEYKRMVDPPSGWKYGFPKELPKGKKYEELLIESGYPKEDVEFAMKYSRQWYEDESTQTMDDAAY